jgi:hypothetical protein
MKKIQRISFLLILFLPIFGFSQCKGDCENGYGSRKYPSGDKYVGEWVDSRYEGEGTLTWNKGNKYVGEWVNGRFEGEGILTLKATPKDPGNQLVKYIGSFVNSKFDGKGTSYYMNGLEWIGMWEKGEQLDGHLNVENYYNPEDIIGEATSIEIHLQKVEGLKNTFIIPISFGDIDQDFLFDTGASGMSISKSFLSKLKKNNVNITTIHIKNQTAEDASGRPIKVKYVLIDNISIGDYTLNNVVAMVNLETKDASLLFGSEVFNKFSSWNGPGSKGVITLSR